jgi:hypothetical protein
MLTKKHTADMDQELMQRTVLKKREDFAISLRKKKHTEIIQTKRRSNMQKAFERTVVASSQIEGQTNQPGADNFMEIIDVNHLKDVIQNFDDPKFP